MRLVFVLFWLATAAQFFVVPTTAQDREAIVTAEFRPLYSEWLDWRTRIYADGLVEQDLQSEPDPLKEQRWSTRELRRLTPKKLASLYRLATSASFWDLAPRYSCDVLGYRVTDQDTLVLSIKQGGRSHRVQVYGAEYAAGIIGGPIVNPHRTEVHRFLRVWSAVLDLVSSPNRKQKPKVYRPPKDEVQPNSDMINTPDQAPNNHMNPSAGGGLAAD